MVRAIGLLVALAVSTATCVPPTTDRPAPRSAVAERLARDVALLADTTIILRFDPPPIYAAWEREVELCSGLVPPAERPTYWVAQALRLGPQKKWFAMYIAPPRVRIVFAIGFETVPWVVRHEYLHHLSEGRGHPLEYFGPAAPCGQLVNPPAG